MEKAPGGRRTGCRIVMAARSRRPDKSGHPPAG